MCTAEDTEWSSAVDCHECSSCHLQVAIQPLDAETNTAFGRQCSTISEADTDTSFGRQLSMFSVAETDTSFGRQCSRCLESEISSDDVDQLVDIESGIRVSVDAKTAGPFAIDCTKDDHVDADFSRRGISVSEFDNFDNFAQPEPDTGTGHVVGMTDPNPLFQSQDEEIDIVAWQQFGSRMALVLSSIAGEA